MNPQLFNTLVPALLHTLWIGVVASAVLFLALRKIAAGNARFRYALGIVALVTVFIGGLIAWEWPSAEPQSRAVVALKVNPMDQSNPSYQLQPSAAPILPEAQATNLQPQTANWHLWLGMVWMLGAVISLLRLVRVSVGIQKLVRRSRVVEHPVAIRLVAELSRIAGTSRRVLLLTGEHVLQPAVAGTFRPAIFLPLSVITGLPEWQLRAILAHELAHIVRHDFLINALQLLAETILFFNPAVWWINCRIREEREACCDALAANWIDNNHELAETLIEQATFENSALPAFSDSNPGTLKSRILRLINPSQQPSLKLPWKSLLLVALIAVGGLLIAKKGASEVVGYLKRLQKLEEAQLAYESPVQTIIRSDVHGFEECIAEFTIKSADGSPINLPIYFTYQPRSSRSIGEQISEGEVIDGLGTGELRVRKKIEYGSRIETLDVQTADFALFRGTGAAANADGIAQLPEIVLEKGFEARLRFVDPSGNPVPNVAITSLIIMGSGTVKKRQADANGEFVIPACGSYPIWFSIVPPEGFAPESRSIEFEEGITADWVLAKAQLFSGKVIDGKGRPIAGASIYLFEDNRDPFKSSLFTNRIAATTSANGKFEFRKMQKNEKYTIGVTAKGYWGRFHVGSTAKDRGKTYTLREGGEVLVNLRNLKANTRYLNFAYIFETGDGGSHSYSFPREWCSLVSSGEAEATYKLHSLWEGEYSLRYESIYHRFKSTEVKTPIELDIAELAKEQADRTLVKHRVELTFVTPENEPMPKGTIELNYRHEGWKTCAIPSDGKIVAEVDMSRSRRLEVSVGQMSGYTFDSRSFDSATTNFNVACTLVPAGGAALTCTDTAGKLLTDCYFVVYEKMANHSPGKIHMQRNYRNIVDGSCMVEPLAFDRKYKIRVSCNRTEEEGGSLEYESDWFSVSKSRPVKKLTCVLKPVK